MSSFQVLGYEHLTFLYGCWLNGFFTLSLIFQTFYKWWGVSQISGFLQVMDWLLYSRVVTSGFSVGRLHMGGGGGFVPPYGGDKALMGGGLMRGNHEGDIDLIGGLNFDRLYHKLKVLLLLSCNYMMQFVGYDSIQTRWFVPYRFQIRTITQHQYKRIGAMNCIM